MTGSTAVAGINYGDFNANNYIYRQVTESSITDPVPLFNAPTVSGDTLKFNPTFGSISSAGNPGFAQDTTDGQLNFGIDAKPGAFISQFSFNEAGDYSLVGLPTAFAQATVSCPVNVRVTEVNGVALGASILGQFSLTFTGGGIYIFPPTNTGGLWSGSGSFDVAAFLAANGIQGVATKVEIAIDNKLTTLASNGATAQINKKLIDGVTIQVTPAPASLALLGLGGLVAARRRRA
jgi:MYXO-CTERM domain-containing protein